MIKNLEKYYDMALELSLIPPEKRNVIQIEKAIKKLEVERNRTVRTTGINEYAIQLQEIISELYIDLKEAKNEPYDKNLENLEYIISINIKRAQSLEREQLNNS